MKDLIKCKLCGSLHEKENVYVINPDTEQEFYVCNICVHNREIFECIDCGNRYTQDFYWGCYQGGQICDNCRGNYFVCNRFDSVFPQEELNYDDVCNEDLCESCMNERYYNLDDVIEDYYHKPDPIFYGDSPDNAFLGVELEVDNTSGDYDKKLIYEAANIISKDFEDLVYEILKVVINDNKGIEINTSNVRYGVKDLTPSRDILKIYHDLGGEIITIGSDSHTREHLGFHIQYSQDILKDLGFKYFCTFKDMKPIFNKL